MDFKINEKYYLNKEITQALQKYFEDTYSKIAKYNRVVVGEFCVEEFENGVFDNVNEDEWGALVESRCYGIQTAKNIVRIGHSNVITDIKSYVYLDYNGMCYPFESIYFKWNTFVDDKGDTYAIYGFFYDNTPVYCFIMEGDSYVPYCEETIKAAKKFLFSEEC